MREEYLARINRVIDHIEANLEASHSLESLAQVAHFSPYHFHRIFSAMVGETLYQFIQRLRLEKAASQLIENHKKSITEVALDCGFSGSATFARAFKEFFQMSASEWRSSGGFKHSKKSKTNHKNRKTLSNFRKDFEISSHYIDAQTNNPIWRIKMKQFKETQVEVKEMPEVTVAYVRHVGPYKGDTQLFEGLFQKLMTWAGPRGLCRFPETQVMAVYHDNPEVTDDEKLRTSACISVAKDTPVEGEIGKMTVPGGKFAVARFELNGDEYEEAWNTVMGGWLPESGYQPDDRLCYELYHNNPKEHPENKHIVDICIPVRPL